MKALHLCAYYLYSYMFSHLIDSLEAQKIDCDVFVPTHKNTEIAINPADNVYHPVCFNYYDRAWFSLKSKKIYACLIQTLNIDKYDIVHAHTIFTDGNIALKLKKEYGKPYLIAVRSTDLEVFFKYMIHLRALGIEIMSGASKIIFLSDTHRRYTIETYVPKSKRNEFYAKSIVIPNGIAPIFHENRLEYKQCDLTPPIKLITIGDISKRKNQITVCNAVDVLKKRGYEVSYTVVGKATDQAMYENLITNPAVRYFPFMPQEKLLELYRKADIFVLASLKETFGLVYAEAMSQGLPVVYTKDEGFDGQFPEGEVGYHVNPQSPDEIADAVEQILEKYNTLRKNCIEGINKFDWDVVAANCKEIYRNVIGI